MYLILSGITYTTDYLVRFRAQLQGDPYAQAWSCISQRRGNP